jgi:flavin-dependent dehydrogenase
MVHFDAIAIGGGLAGAAFALELARNGLKVAVVERTRGPLQKVCGDFHSREAQALLAGLGIDAGRLGASRIGTFRLASGRTVAQAPLPFAAAGLSRQTLDEVVLAAAGNAGAEIIRGATATALEPRDGRALVRIGPRVLESKAAALATGKHNMRGWPRAPGALAAFKIGLDPAPAARADLSGVVQLAGYRGGYAGACVVEGGAVPVCWLADERLMKETGGNWRRQLSLLSRLSAHLGDLLSGARFLADAPVATAAIPFGYLRREVIGENIFPVGDQLAVIPSLTGDGTSLALASGLSAARALLDGTRASAYQRTALTRLRAQFRWARLLQMALTNGPMRALGIAALAAAPSLASVMVELTRARALDDLLSARAA